MICQETKNKKIKKQRRQDALKLPTDNFRFTNRTSLLMRLEESSCVSDWKVYDNYSPKKTNNSLYAAGFNKSKQKVASISEH